MKNAYHSFSILVENKWYESLWYAFNSRLSSNGSCYRFTIIGLGYVILLQERELKRSLNSFSFFQKFIYHRNFPVSFIMFKMLNKYSHPSVGRSVVIACDLCFALKWISIYCYVIIKNIEYMEFYPSIYGILSIYLSCTEFKKTGAQKKRWTYWPER